LCRDFEALARNSIMAELRNLTAPSLDDIARLAREEYDRLPHEFRENCGEIVFRVEDFADEAVLDELDAGSEFEVTGLFVGQELAAQDASAMPREPSIIFLYRVPILAEWAESGVGLGQLVSHVIVHEIGHHFGLSDGDMERIEDEDEDKDEDDDDDDDDDADEEEADAR
jgi:predicted Zn-dependent protease with MMP-like domain